MCGIFGMILGAGAGFSSNLVKNVAAELLMLSESRGKEAAGVAVFCNGKENIHKDSVSARFLVCSKEYKALFSGLSGAVSLLGHTRLATNGDYLDNHNNCPITCGTIVGVHNGIVVNDEVLWKELPLIGRKGVVDSEILFSLLDFFVNNKRLSLIDSVQNIFRRIEGSASIAAFISSCQSIVLATNTGSLYFCSNIFGSVKIFSSEPHILEKVIKKFRLSRVIGDYRIDQIRPKQGRIIGRYTLREDMFSL